MGKQTPFWLLGGALAGLTMALAGAIGPAPAPDRQGVLAQVNGVAVTRGDFERGLSALAADKTGPLEEDDKAFVLRKLIEEELLVQRALDLDLVRADRRIRKSLISTMIETVVAESNAQDADEETLKRFYADEPALFTKPVRLAVEGIYLLESKGPVDGRAAQVKTALAAGEPFDTVRARLSDGLIAPPPQSLLPPAKLRDYLGPEATRAALDLKPGAVSEALAIPGGRAIVRITAREDATLYPFDTVRAIVAEEYRRQKGDDALRAALDQFYGQADIRYADDAPRSAP